MLDCERPEWPLMGAYCRRQLEKIMSDIKYYFLTILLTSAMIFESLTVLAPNGNWLFLALLYVGASIQAAIFSRAK